MFLSDIARHILDVSSTRGVMQRTLILTILLILNVSCATPVPPASSYFRDGVQPHSGLPVDLAMVETAKLSQDKKHVAR